MATAAPTQVQIDPITTEIIRSAFTAAADEMNATLIRSAYTPVIYEMKDCSVALLDAEHQVLGQSAGLPIFLGNLEICTRLTEEMYGRDAWQPGDVWIMNDSYLTGTHLNDMTVFGPIFHDSELVGFAASRAHWLDVGAKDPGGPMDSTSIYQEGIRLGPTKVVEGGVQKPDVTDLLGRNSRFSYPAIGDLGAQIACARTGQQRLSAIIARYGSETIAAAREAIFAQTERFERAAVAAIPDGTYSAEGCLDNDGNSDEPCWVRLTVEIRGEGRVESIVLGRNELVRDPESGAVRAVDTGEREELECGLVLRSIGYLGAPIEGLPFDERGGVIPNEHGRVVDPDSGEQVPGIYVVGWIKRGPSGVIGTNKKDAQDTVTALLEDARAERVPERTPGAHSAEEIARFIQERCPDCVGFEGWQAIDRAEVERGEPHGRPRIKFCTIAEMVEAARTTNTAAAN